MEIRNYVAGAWSRPAARDQLPVINPATNQEIGRVPVSSAEEVDRAVLDHQLCYVGNADADVLGKFNPATEKFTLISTCFPTHHLNFAEDANQTLWTSSGVAGKPL